MGHYNWYSPEKERNSNWIDNRIWHDENYNIVTISDTGNTDSIANWNVTLGDAEINVTNSGDSKLNVSLEGEVVTVEVSGGTMDVSLGDETVYVATSGDTKLNVGLSDEEIFVTNSGDSALVVTISGASALSSGESVVEGNLKKQLVQDTNSELLLTNVLKELKIMNIHLSILTDTVIQKTEIE